MRSIIRVCFLSLLAQLCLIAGLYAGDGPGAAGDATGDASGGVFSASVLPEALRDRMKGVSWREGCPVPLDDLRLLKVDHVGFDGRPHHGQLVVHKDAADEVLSIFVALYRERFPIEKIRLIEEYGGSDDASMRDDNTSAFNCRPVTGGKAFSRHAYGRAIDINPLFNPYVRGETVLPPEGAAFADRSLRARGMIFADDACRRAFSARGWDWGGAWRTRKDYQHFEKKTP